MILISLHWYMAAIMDIMYFCEKHRKNYLRGVGCGACCTEERKNFLIKKEKDQEMHRQRILRMKWPLSKYEKQNGVTFA